MLKRRNTRVPSPPLSLLCCEESSESSDTHGLRSSVSWGTKQPKLLTLSSILGSFEEHFHGYVWFDKPVIYEKPSKNLDIFSEATDFGFVVVNYPAVDEIMQATHFINGKQVSIERTVLVTMVPKTLGEGDFKRFFSKFGKIVAHEIVCHPITKESLGFGFVIFDSDDVVRYLLGEREINLYGTKVEVKKARIVKTSYAPLNAFAGSPAQKLKATTPREFFPGRGGYGQVSCGSSYPGYGSDGRYVPRAGSSLAFGRFSSGGRYDPMYGSVAFGRCDGRGHARFQGDTDRYHAL